MKILFNINTNYFILNIAGSSDILKYGTVNNCFEMDDDLEIMDQDLKKNALKSTSLNVITTQSVQRPPTPPLRLDQPMVCCFDDLIQSINQLDIDFNKENYITNTNVKLIEQFKEIMVTKNLAENSLSLCEDTSNICIELNDTNNYCFKSMQEKTFECLALATNTTTPPTTVSNTTSPSNNTSSSPVISNSNSSSNAISPSSESNSTNFKTGDSSKESNNEDLTQISKTIEIQDLFKHIDLIQNKIESIKQNHSSSGRNSSTPTTMNRNSENMSARSGELVTEVGLLKSGEDAFDLEKFFSSCNQDINLLVRLCETDNFKNTLNLYNKLIKLNASLALKPVASNSHHLSQEVFLIKKHTKIAYNPVKINAFLGVNK